MTPQSRRKSILVRMMRPVSVAFGEKDTPIKLTLNLDPTNGGQLGSPAPGLWRL